MINNVAAYEAARTASIKANRRVGNARRWVAEVGEAEVQRVTDFLFCTGEFALVPVTHADGSASSRLHPLVAAAQGAFYGSLSAALNEWGRLTPGQHKAALDLMARAANRVVERAEAHAARAATSQHIGTVGQRITLDVTIKLRRSFDGMYGPTFVFVCETAQQAVVVYKGSSVLGEQGETLRVTATVTEHGMRDGVAQTIIKRPKVLAA